MSELADVQIAMESWAKLWPDAAPLAELHFSEVDGGVEPRRRMRVDTEQLALACLAGPLKIWAARRERKLLGYVLWTVQLDPEAKGLVIAQMGPWFVVEGEEKGLGARLFKESLAGLKSMGVQCCFPHHRMQGRGAELGKFFTSLGAIEIQHTYSLWIGDTNA